MGKITEEELAMLSDEERAAIADDTDTKSTEEIRADEEAAAAAKAKEDGGGGATRADAKSVSEKTDAEKAADIAKTAEETEAAAKAKAAADAEAAAKVQSDKEAADLATAQAAEAAEKAKAAAAIQTPVTPLFTLEAEKKHGTKEEIDTKMKALDEKFEEGEIKLADYNSQRAEYVEALTEMKMFGKINTQVHQAAAEKSWKDSQADFFKENPEYSTVRFKNLAFVDVTNRILQTPEAKTMTDAQVLKAAKEECDTFFAPKAVEKPADKKAAEDAAAAAAKVKADGEATAKALDAAKKLEADKSAGVKTLAKVPVSEGNVGEDRWDMLDKLVGDDYEIAVAKLSDQERAIYAARE